MRTQLQHLCQILGINCQERVANVDALRRAKRPALKHSSQLRWAGHVRCMPYARLPKAVVNGELSVAKRKHCGQELCFKDVLKRYMKNSGINPDTWEQKALDQNERRKTVKRSIKRIEEKRLNDYQRAMKEDTRLSTGLVWFSVSFQRIKS